MKFSFVFLLLLDAPRLNGQQRIEEFEHISLRLAFPSFYNSYNKSCCKLYPGGCYKLLDSAGYICDLLRGRVTKTEGNGWTEFKISNVRFTDGGYYRCMLDTQNRIYQDYYVEVFEASNRHSHPQPPLPTTAKAPITSRTTPESTGPALTRDHSDSPKVSFGLPVAAIASIAALIFITSVVAVVCFIVKAKPKRRDMYGETLCESVKQEALETTGIVYTTVDFAPQQKCTELYANLRAHTTQGRDPASAWSTEPPGMVEYSTLAVHQ